MTSSYIGRFVPWVMQEGYWMDSEWMPYTCSCASRLIMEQRLRLTKMKIEDWIQRWSTHKRKSCATWDLVVWSEFVNCALCTNPYYVLSMFLRVRWFSWARIEKEISSVYERMTSSVDDHGWQGQVQDNHPKGLHAWSLWMITWWTHEDKYKAKLPTLCMGEILEDFTNVLPFNLIQEETSTSSSSERLESKVLVPSTLVLWSDEHRRNTYTQEWIIDSYVV